MCSCSQDVCLIPEIPFELAGPTGLFRCVDDLFNTQGHCVIVVAEGAGMELIDGDLRSYGTDASGNVKRPDIGLWLRARLNEHFASLGQELNLKLIEYDARLMDSVGGGQAVRAVASSWALRGGHGSSPRRGLK